MSNRKVNRTIKRRVTKAIKNNGQKQKNRRIIKVGKDNVEIMGRPISKRALSIGTSLLLTLSLTGSSAFTKYMNYDGTVDYIPIEQADNAAFVDSILSNTRVNENGKVVGIDVSESLPAEELERILSSDNAIPETVYDVNGVEHDIEDLAGPVDFVMIKIGARGYGEPGNFADIGDSYLEQAEVCERLGIPYGFYFYSTALNKDEALEEVEVVKANLDRLGERKYNLMDLTLDVEQDEHGSRINGKDVTDVMAYWANKAEELTGHKVMLYTGGRDVSGPEKILDIPRFNEQLDSGPARIWIPGPRVPDGSEVYYANQEQINSVANENGDIAIIQAILEQTNPEQGLVVGTDIDIMDVDVFKKIIRENGRTRLKEIDGQDELDDDIEEIIDREYDSLQLRVDTSKLDEDRELKQEIQEEEKVGFWERVRGAVGGLFNKIFHREETLELPESFESDEQKQRASTDFRDSLKVEELEEENPDLPVQQASIDRKLDEEER